MSMPWYGESPNRWDMQKVSELFVERRDKVSDTDYPPLSVSKGGIVPQIATVAKSNAGDNRKLVKIGDFAINSRSDRRGSSGLSQYDGSVSLINIVLTPRLETNGKYWHYLLKCHDFIEEYYRNGRGIVADLWTTRYTEMKTIYLPLPPRDEQDQIVRYLDWKISLINKLINAKRWQIALLQEQKQATIFFAVTRGICQNASLKKSSIDWIGGIPNHWEVRTLYGVAVEQYISNKDIRNQNLLSLSYGNIVNKDINTTEGLLPSSFDTYQILNDGNIVLRLTDLQNDHKSLRVGLSTQTGIITSAYTCLIVRPEFVPSYVYYLLHAYDICKVFYGMGGGVRQSIGYKDIRKLPMLVPPKPEQHRISVYLDELKNNSDRVEGKLTNEIALLSEYRTRLISDVITGKLDVRSVAVPEYEVVEETADADDTVVEESESDETEE